MEYMEGIEKMNNAYEEHIAKATEEISNKFISAAEKYLPEGDPKRDQIIQFYSDFDRLYNELATVFAGQTPEKVVDQVKAHENLLEDEEAFKSYIQKKDFSTIDSIDETFRSYLEKLS